MSAVTGAGPAVHYPDSDGQPMSDNTLQFRWIVTIQGNLDDLYRDTPDVFVAGDHLIYPVKGDPKARQAPDVYVAFGRPKGDRGSYKVWDEGGVFPQVVFEVWSPHNRASAMQKKFEFYERHGAEEYYIVYPDFPTHLDGWRREGDRFVEIDPMDGWVSPRLGVRFERTPEDIVLYRPDGSPFLSFLEMAARAEGARRQAEKDAQLLAAERERADRLAAKLRELGLDPDAV